MPNGNEPANHVMLTGSGNARYPKSLRLLNPAEFRFVFESAHRSGDRAFTLLARANGIGRPRLGMAIAKKKVRGSVARNRIRRQIRESFRHVRPDLPAVDIVVLVRDGAAGWADAELRSELTRHWARLSKRLGMPAE